ncbi:MAG TPA: hypothetical protein VK639_12595 [Terriglobales bacterium]|nr:hypothetical protein [Terriglobales bacterium]
MAAINGLEIVQANLGALEERTAKIEKKGTSYVQATRESATERCSWDGNGGYFFVPGNRQGGERTDCKQRRPTAVASSPVLARDDILQLRPITLKKTVISRQVNDRSAKNRRLAKYNPSRARRTDPNVLDSPNMSKWHKAPTTVIADLNRITGNPNSFQRESDIEENPNQEKDQRKEHKTPPHSIIPRN